MVLDTQKHDKVELIDRPETQSQRTNHACRSFPSTTRLKTHREPAVGSIKAVVPEEISALSSMTTTREGGHSKRGQDARLRVSLSREHNFNERREEVLQVKKIVLHLVKHTKSICTLDVIGIPVIIVTSCEGGVDVVGVVTPLVRGGAQVLHGDQVVELSVLLEVHENEEEGEDGEGQIEVESERGELKERRTCTWMT